jgi:alginate O-acetyltransferase complex protein AlgJ
VFTMAPDKHVIYPEEMPSTIQRIGNVSRTDQVFDVLGKAGIKLVDPRPALLAAKTHERVYQQTDTHWNDRGAFVAYQEVIAAVRAQLPSVPQAWTRDDFEPVERLTEGKDLAGMIGLTRVLHERDLVLEPRRPRLARTVDPPGGQPTDELGRIVTEIPGSQLPRAVVFRDSFFSGTAPFLAEHFSRMVVLWQNDFDADVVSREHPDVVIQEIVGRHLYEFLPSPELIPK